MPQDIAVEEIGTSSVVVSIVGVEGNPNVILYKTTARGGNGKHECRVTRETVPLHCKLTGLQPATHYTISVSSCLSGDRCGDALTTEVTTNPQGSFAYNCH